TLAYECCHPDLRFCDSIDGVNRRLAAITRAADCRKIGGGHPIRFRMDGSHRDLSFAGARRESGHDIRVSVSRRGQVPGDAAPQEKRVRVLEAAENEIRISWMQCAVEELSND